MLVGGFVTINLPLGVNQCMNVCAWCFALDWCPIQALCVHKDPDKV